MQTNNTDFVYTIYTISDLENWLFHNADNGISERIISRTRALSFVKNPMARPDDAVLSVVFNADKQPIGYTAVFAETWVRPYAQERYFWGSTQWLEPQYRGKGASWNMMWKIKEAVNQKYIASDSTVASCKLDKKQGSLILYYPRFFARFKRTGNSVKEFLKEKWVENNNKQILKRIQARNNFVNHYINYIDDETYQFICKHSSSYLFLRKQEMLNWQLFYPFVLATSGDPKRNREKCEFGEYVKEQRQRCIKVYHNDDLCGLYVLNNIDEVCTVQYLYMSEPQKDIVYSSILANVLMQDVKVFRTFSADLFQFMEQTGICRMNAKNVSEQVSLTIPNDFEVSPSLSLQGGDGDMFT